MLYRFTYQYKKLFCELGATKLELFVPLKQAIISHWELQEFNQDFLTKAGEYKGFVDYFKY